MSSKFQLIELSYLESIADGDNEILAELINIFLDQVPEYEDGFDTYFKEKNWKDLAALAHKAKSSVLSMGMENLGNEDLKNLELISKSFRIKELEEKNDLSEKEENEIKNLYLNIKSYPEKKQDWIKSNGTEETMKSIIDNFRRSCDIASTELKNVLVKK
ncbi:Hpt domain-containing protein [Alkalitalea saponilacus]|uniref:HPt domain-containing protein n=1 Tax=Alkalitalea saponilacus TaxID=889453 RepID=A0A1T5HAD7_9BACT|nr:Hpt domain-containing protein [Alkalitalea saponilacus]ASB50798.1 Hpt domain-containing protein [Alkalitalea saponilacus]SKC17648.1 hypothetical protein SAMN03080601_02182 [Alkalitalea saponilacus]